MSSIMDLVDEYAQEVKDFGYCDVSPSAYNNIKSEVTCMEAELEAMIAENHRMSDLWSAMKAERDELRTKLAALDNLLLVIDERVGNGMIPWEIEDAFAEYGAAGAKAMLAAPGAKP